MAVPRPNCSPAGWNWVHSIPFIAITPTRARATGALGRWAGARSHPQALHRDSLRLLPYIYTGMEETSRTGIPLMRPMFLEFPDQKDFETTDTEFMFGRDLLIAPKQQDTTGGYDVTFPNGVWVRLLVQLASARIEAACGARHFGVAGFCRGDAVDSPRRPSCRTSTKLRRVRWNWMCMRGLTVEVLSTLMMETR